jgi:cell envelope opacity-associated protein A
MTQKPSWEEIDRLLQELVQFHQSQLLKCGRRIIPHLTPEDLLQPNDYQELEHNPHFRYEEGVLAGVQTVQMALWALKKQETR